MRGRLLLKITPLTVAMDYVLLPKIEVGPGAGLAIIEGVLRRAVMLIFHSCMLI